MHPILHAALKDRELSDSAKLLLSALYSRTNGTLAAAIEVDELLDDLGIAESTLRRRRSELATAGWLTSRLDGGMLHVEILDGSERAPSARSEDEGRAPTARLVDDNAHLLRADRAPTARSEDEDRAPTARLEDASAHLLRGQRAPSARSAPRAERENAESTPPCTPRRGIVKHAVAGKSTSTTGGSAEGADRTALLLVAAGVETEAAGHLAKTYGLEAVARHIAAWQIAKVNMRLGVGALIHRITKWPVPVVAVADMRAGILADHIDDDDLKRWKLFKDPLAGYDVPAGYEDIVRH